MNKIKNLTLDNGLKVVLIKNSKVHRSSAYIKVDVGSNDISYKSDDKIINIIPGLQHFTEHLVIEHSKYGNSLKLFGDNFVDSNGATSRNITYFYISTVHDFMEYLEKLIYVVNGFIDDDKAFDDVKVPIYSEIDRANDNPNRLLYNKILESSLYTCYTDTLGTKESVKGISLDDFKMFYDTFYQPSNETLFIVGSFKEKEVLELINKTFNNIKRNYHRFIKYQGEEKPNIKYLKTEVIDTYLPEVLAITYKLDIRDMDKYDREKLEYYLQFYISDLFGETSDCYKEIIKNNYSNYSFSYNNLFDIVDGFALINLSIPTKEFDSVINLISECINSYKINDDHFNLFKNRCLINYINGEDNINNVFSNYWNRTNVFKINEIKGIDWYKDRNITECRTFIKNIEFDNIGIVIRKK